MKKFLGECFLCTVTIVILAGLPVAVSIVTFML